MRHELIVEGPAFRLRPITDEDAPLIVELRSDAKRSRYLHPISLDIKDQLAWLTDYYERAGDYYFVVERRDSNAAEGLVSLYDINPVERSGEWGRWILKPDSLAAVESALLIYRCAFEQLDLERVYCRTIARNRSAVSFHDSCGITDRFLLSAHYYINGVTSDAIEHQVTKETWASLSLRLQKQAESIARRIRVE